MQEIAIRVRITEQDRVGLADYERIVGSVATVTALTAWLPNPDARLVIRGRGAEPVRLETASYGSVFDMLVVLDQRGAVVERAASTVAALVESVRHESLREDAVGIAGALDRLDRAAPRGRSAVERSLRVFLEGARADVLARRTTTTRVRAAQALLRLAEDGAEVRVERIEDELVADVGESPVATDDGGGAVVVVGAVPGAAVSADGTSTAGAVDGIDTDLAVDGVAPVEGQDGDATSGAGASATPAGTVEDGTTTDTDEAITKTSGDDEAGKKADAKAEKKAGTKRAGTKKAAAKKADAKAGTKKADAKAEKKAGTRKAGTKKAAAKKADAKADTKKADAKAEKKAGTRKADAKAEKKAGTKKAGTRKADAKADAKAGKKKAGKKNAGTKKADAEAGTTKAGTTVHEEKTAGGHGDAGTRTDDRVAR